MKLIEKIRRIGKKSLPKMDEGQLCDAIRSDNKPQTKFGRMLLRIKNVEETSLITIMKHLPFLRKKVWKRLLKKDLTDCNLKFIIREIKSLRIEASEKLLELYPSEENRLFVEQYKKK